MPFVQVSEMLGTELKNPTVQNDPKLRLFALTAKGYTDLYVNLASCRAAWEQALVTARDLGDRNWEARATGELGIVAFLEGDRTKAEKLVGSALLSVMKNGDVAAIAYARGVMRNRGGAVPTRDVMALIDYNEPSPALPDIVSKFP